MINLLVHDDDDGQRVDRFLRKALHTTPLGEIQRLLRTGAVRTADGRRLKHDSRVDGGDTLCLPESTELPVSGPAPAIEASHAYDIASHILFEDDDLLIINKPPHINVHPGDHKSKEVSIIELVQDYLRAAARKGLFEPALAHRLDRDTSGVLMIAKNRLSLNILLEELQSHKMTKDYIALVIGGVTPSAGTISLPLLRREGEVGPKVIVDKTGQRAVTHYDTIAKGVGLALLKVKLETGRMHQIRVHLCELGAPVLGDTKYGIKIAKANRQDLQFEGAIKRQQLHAYSLSFTHPRSRQLMTIRAPLPLDMQEICKLAMITIPDWLR